MTAAFSTLRPLLDWQLAARLSRGNKALVKIGEDEEMGILSGKGWISLGEQKRRNTVHPEVLNHLLLSHRVQVAQLALLVARIVYQQVQATLANQVFQSRYQMRKCFGIGHIQLNGMK